MYSLDTDIIIEFLRGNEKVVKKLISLSDEGLYTSTLSLAELYHGVYESSQIEENTKKLMDFLSNVGILNLDLEVCNNFGRLKSQLKKQGAQIDNFDLLIACICLKSNLILVTNNEKHFQRIKELKILTIK